MIYERAIHVCELADFAIIFCFIARHNNMFEPLQREDRLRTPESDVYRHDRCLILTSEVVPRTEKVKLFIMAVDP